MATAAKRLTRSELEAKLALRERELATMRLKAQETVETRQQAVYLLRREGASGARAYTVGSARSLRDVPAANGETERACRTLHACVAANASAESLAAELKRYLRPAGDGAEGEHAVPFDEAKQWLDFVVGRAVLESIADADARRALLADVNKVLARAERVLLGDEATIAADEAKDVAKEKAAAEAKKVADFFAERVVRADEGAPPLAKSDIIAMYRIWARGLSLQSTALLTQHLADHANAERVVIGDLADGAVGYKGIALRKDDWKHEGAADDPLTRFFGEECLFLPCAKTLGEPLAARYAEWRVANGFANPGETITEARAQLRQALKDHRLVCAGTVTVGEKVGAGWNGLALRNAPHASAIGLARRGAQRRVGKAVEYRTAGPEGRVLGAWPSLSQATKALKMSPQKLANLIAKGAADERGAFYAFADADAATPSSAAGDP